jgi:transketolase
MRKQFVKTVESLLEKNDNITLLLGDIGVFGFRNSLSRFKDRVFNIGILEQSTVGLAAGLSKSGLIPIVHTIAPFMVERALEQLKIDFGYQQLKGNFVSIGSSYDYTALGSTHHCPADIAILKNIPNFQIAIPGNSDEFDTLFNSFYDSDFPTYYRLSDFENKTQTTMNPGDGCIIKRGQKATIICVGNLLDTIVESTENIDVTILYYNMISPFDHKLLENNFNENIIICEPYYSGLLNFEINKFYLRKKTRVLNIGIPLKFIDNFGSKFENDQFLELDSVSVRKKIIEFLND